MTASVEPLRRNGARLVDLVRTTSDLAAPVPGSTWTVGETIAHVTAGFRNHAAMARGSGRPYRSVDSIAAENQEMLATVGDPSADALAAAVDDLADALEQYPDDEPFRWHAGIEISRADEIGVTTGEAVVHGYDVARAVKAPWPISRDDAVVVLDASTALAPHFLDVEAAAQMRATFEIRVRGNGRYRFAFADGVLETSRVDRVPDADCRLSADAVAFLLVAFGRKSQWWAAATGKVVAWGHKPWLGLQFAGLLRAP